MLKRKGKYISLFHFLGAPLRPTVFPLMLERVAGGGACASTYASSNCRIMRWYCVWFFSACDLKNSTLRLLSAIVTFTPSSRKASWSGGGRKSRTTRTSPMGSLVYFVFVVIDVPPLLRTVT